MKNKIETHHLIYPRKIYNKGLSRQVREHKNALIRLKHNDHKELHHEMYEYFGDHLMYQKFSHNSLLGIDEYNNSHKSQNTIKYLGDLAIVCFDDDYAKDFLLVQKNIIGGI